MSLGHLEGTALSLVVAMVGGYDVSAAGGIFLTTWEDL